MITKDEAIAAVVQKIHDAHPYWTIEQTRALVEHAWPTDVEPSKFLAMFEDAVVELQLNNG